jgi:hypothetical protein
MCMLHNHQDQQAQHDRTSGHSIARWYKSPVGILLLALAVALGYYLWVYHSQHVLAFLPFIFILACPLMHLLMHRNHGHRHQPETIESKTGGRHEGA